MTDRKLTNVAASVRQRLLNRAKAEGLTAPFAEDPTKQAQWAGFVRKSRLEAPSLAEVVEVAARLAEGGFERARRGR